MAVYFSKSRNAWYIRYSWKGKLYYCYRSSSGVFVTKQLAKDYEPVFVSGLVEAPVASGLCDSFFEPFVLSLKGSLKDSTVYGFAKVFDKYVAPHFKGVKVSALDDGFLEFVNRKLNLSVSVKDPQRLFSVCRHFVLFLNRQGLSLDPNRFYPNKRKVREPHVYHVWDLPTFERFLSFEKDPNWILFFSVLYYYGLRVGEALGLQWGDFTGHGLRIARMVSVKNLSKELEVTLPKTASSVSTLPKVEAVYRYVLPGLDPCSWCFLGRGGSQPFGQTTVVNRIKLVSKKAGLKWLSPHEFRHSCASYLISQGVPLREVSKWLRHSNEIVTASVYEHLLPGEIDKVGQFWDKKMG
jgi:Site-specific recombinase XerD